MNNVLTALCGVINFMPPWIMLGVFGAIVLLIILIIALKGLKRWIFRRIITLLVVLCALSYLAYLGVQIALLEEAEDKLQVITFFISWGPTIIFGLFVLYGIYRGMRRGLRKSLIFALHVACSAVVSIAFYLIMVYVKEVDAGYVNFVNLFMGGEGSLQRALGASESCSTLKEVLAAYIPNVLPFDYSFILQENVAYLYTLVDLVYRLIFAIQAWLMFIAFNFVLRIVYWCCYSEYRYKRTKTAEFVNGKTDRTYKKHRFAGGAVGLVRGLVSGLLAMSFLGSVFFIAAGGKGEGKLDDHDFGNDEANYYYQIYRSIESYGAQGIFKILNEMSDAADTPYYLFAADLIFSGELNDEDAGISENVKFREEFAALTGFARDTMELFMKYGSDEINSIAGGDTDNAFDTVLEVMTRTGFKEEFSALIDAFDTQTYIINLSMSLVNSIVSNIDVTAPSLGEGERELIKLIFKKGFLSENIPDERDLMLTTGNAEADGNDVRPYIRVSHILDKSDVQIILNTVFTILAGEGTGDTLQLVKNVIPEISKLSILSTDKKSTFNPVLARMYCLFENLYLTADGEDGVTYSEIAQDGIDWIGEINALLDVVPDTFTLYENLSGGEAGALNILKALFDSNNEHYSENMAIYDKLCTLLTESRVMGRALATNFVFRTLTEALAGLAPNIYIPEEITFANTYDKNGNLIAYGETYQLLYGVKLLMSEDNADLLATLTNMGSETAIDEVLEMIADAVSVADGNGNTLADYLTDSVILRSVISIELIEVGGNTFYVPNAAREKVDGVYKPLILKEELKQLLENMTKLVDFVMPFLGEDAEAWQQGIDDFLIYDDSFYELVQCNRIFEGTVARMFNEKITEYSNVCPITVPSDLYGFENIDGWITVDGVQGELLNLLEALRKTEFKVSELLLGNGSFDASGVLENISQMTEAELETFLTSRVLHYTVSDYLLNDAEAFGGDFVLVVPVNSRQPLRGDSIDSLVKKSEIIAVLSEISKLGLNEEGGVEISDILVRIARDKSVLDSSKIIPASIVATLVRYEERADKSMLAIPQYLMEMGKPAELEYYDRTNPWTDELPKLLDALDELFGLSTADSFEFDSEEINNRISELLTSLNDASSVYPDRTKLRVLYDSVIFQYKITEELDSVLTENGIVEEFVINYVKLGGLYKFDEIQALANSVNVLGITDLENLSDFDGIKDKLNKDTLSEIYTSVIVQGIVTKIVQDVINDPENTVLIDHPSAYRSELRVYRESEIYAILSLTNLDDVELDIGRVSEFIYDKATGETQSYIIVASVSEQLIDHAALIIPETVVEKLEGKLYIKPLELSRVLDAFDALVNGNCIDVDALEEWTDDTDITIPDSSVRKVVFESEIMRARIVYQLIKINRTGGGGVLAVAEGNGEKVIDVRETNSVGYTSTVSAEQLEYLARALQIIYGEQETAFKVPVFDSADQILDLSDDLDELLKSDIVRYRICEYIASYRVELPTEPAFNLTDSEPAAGGVKTATAEEIITYAEYIKNYQN